MLLGAALLDAGGAQLLGFLEPVALGIELDHLGPVHEPVDERDDAGGVRDDLAPVGEGLVRAEQDRLLRVVATSDDLEGLSDRIRPVLSISSYSRTARARNGSENLDFAERVCLSYPPKQRLFEFAAYHGLGTLAYRLKHEVQYQPPKKAEELAPALRERAMGHYSNDTAKVLQEVSKHGLEHRSMFGLTPLMMAAEAGNVALVETLIERGARLDAVDSLGCMPVHFALRRAFKDSERRRRVYWNGVLARAEVSSSYKPARKLWRRERQGHYMPSTVGVRVAGEAGKPDTYVPLDRLLGCDILEEQGAPDAASRAHVTSPS